MIGKSNKEKFLFILEKNMISSSATILILVSIFFNLAIPLWIGIIAYLSEFLIEKYYFKVPLGKKDKGEKKKEGKVIDYDFFEKKIK